MMDEYFGLQRFSKVDDPDDVSLLEGAGFFPPDEEYLAYVRDIVATSEEVSWPFFLLPSYLICSLKEIHMLQV